jgi:hypothetical protein
MPETLLDFDTADAFRGRGGVARKNLKTGDVSHIPEISAMMRYGHSRSPMTNRSAHFDRYYGHEVVA